MRSTLPVVLLTWRAFFGLGDLLENRWHSSIQTHRSSICTLIRFFSIQIWWIPSICWHHACSGGRGWVGGCGEWGGSLFVKNRRGRPWWGVLRAGRWPIGRRRTDKSDSRLSPFRAERLSSKTQNSTGLRRERGEVGGAGWVMGESQWPVAHSSNFTDAVKSVVITSSPEKQTFIHLVKENVNTTQSLDFYVQVSRTTQ